MYGPCLPKVPHCHNVAMLSQKYMYMIKSAHGIFLPLGDDDLGEVLILSGGLPSVVIPMLEIFLQILFRTGQRRLRSTSFVLSILPCSLKGQCSGRGYSSVDLSDVAVVCEKVLHLMKQTHSECHRNCLMTT